MFLHLTYPQKKQDKITSPLLVIFLVTPQLQLTPSEWPLYLEVLLVELFREAGCGSPAALFHPSHAAAPDSTEALSGKARH